MTDARVSVLIDKMGGQEGYAVDQSLFVQIRAIRGGESGWAVA